MKTELLRAAAFAVVCAVVVESCAKQTTDDRRAERNRPTAGRKTGPPRADTALAEKWASWRSGRVPFFEIPEREMDRTFDLLAHFLNRIDEDRINFVDVGCAIGDYQRRFMKPKITKKLFSIGIDPIDFEQRAPYSVYAKMAITGKKPGSYDFHLYGGRFKETSSLARIRTDHVTHDEKEKHEKFFHPALIETPRGTIKVDAVPLSHLVEKHGLQDDTIHFLKIDVQGTDLEAFLSLGKYVKNVLFLQLESIYSEKRKHVLYEGQLLFEDEEPVLEKLGFRLLNVARFPAGPEADVMWVNTERFDALSPLTP